MRRVDTSWGCKRLGGGGLVCGGSDSATLSQRLLPDLGEVGVWGRFSSMFVKITQSEYPECTRQRAGPAGCNYPCLLLVGQLTTRLPWYNLFVLHATEASA